MLDFGRLFDCCLSDLSISHYIIIKLLVDGVFSVSKIFVSLFFFAI